MTTHITETATREEVLRRLNDPSVTIVDVLPREAFVAGHIPGSTSLPLEDIPSRASSVLPDRHAEIIVYCGGHT